jgi:alkanesulfonate monooxygenase SsuD/methylene tetrahydromethanopterin reductase-like flavin-dependent oxidoreductase (luciferase family)
VPIAHRGRAYVLRRARLVPRPVQRPGPPVWIAARRPAALALVARRADGWETSYVTPAGFARAWRLLERRLAAARRSPARLARSVELDVALATSAAATARLVGAFRAARRIRDDHPVTAALLAGTPDAVAARIAEYAAAGATDLMLGFADFPSTRMLESFARHVRPRLEALTRGAGRAGAR